MTNNTPFIEPRCKVCNSEWRERINEWLLIGSYSPRQVHGFLVDQGVEDISFQSIQRHRDRGHFSELRQRASAEALVRFDEMRQQQGDESAFGSMMSRLLSICEDGSRRFWERMQKGNAEPNWQDLRTIFTFVAELQTSATENGAPLDKDATRRGFERIVDIAIEYMSVDDIPDFKTAVKYDPTVRYMMGLPPVKHLPPVKMKDFDPLSDTKEM